MVILEEIFLMTAKMIEIQSSILLYKVSNWPKIELDQTIKLNCNYLLLPLLLIAL